MKALLEKLYFFLLWHLPPKTAHTILFYRCHKYRFDWNHPQTYDEKIHWLSVNRYDTSYGKYADKYLVRDYVKSCGLQDLLIPLLGVYHSADEIDYDSLPQEFILKATHGSGKDFFEICHDKNSFRKNHVNRKLNRSLKRNYAKHICQYHYAGTSPRIICEKLLHDSKNDFLTDYKVVCANGEPCCILVCTDRDHGRDYYSADWEYLDYVKEEFRSKIPHEKPALLAEMLEAARVLAQPFPQARIDFYIAENRLYFGEITLTPSGGRHENLNARGQRELGSFITL